MNTIGVFCSASSHIAPVYVAEAEKLGTWIGKQGKTLVYGGSNSGLMECVAKAAKTNGGRVFGVIPTIVESQGKTSDYVDIDFRCNNLSDRKDTMLQESEVMVALPGGIGTLDEIFTIMASATIGYHHKKIILYNVEGFWDKLIELLDELESKNFIRGNWRNYCCVADSFAQLTAFLEQNQ